MVRPSGANISSARARCAAVAKGPAEIAVMARSTTAGVFVITRTTGVPSGSHLAKNDVGSPAQSETTSLPAGTRGPRSASRVAASCGLTAIASTSATIAAALSTTWIPYRPASSSARSGRRAVASSRSADQPDRSNPDSSSSPILPAPMTATVCTRASWVRPAAGRPAATNSAAEEDFRLGVALQRYRLQLAGTGGQRYPHDVGALQRHHLAEVGLVHRVDGRQAEPGGEDPVERGGGAAALDVAEDDGARLLAGARLQLL